MGMYLDVIVVYGVAWNGEDAPSAAYPEGHERAGDQIDGGDPVHNGTLSWGEFGMTMGSPCRYLAVNAAPSGIAQGRYASKVPQATSVQTYAWDTLIKEYCAELGIELDREPGWLALGSFG